MSNYLNSLRPLCDKLIFPFAIGCMGLAEFYGPINSNESILTIKHALDKGIHLIDTADIYGQGLSEKFVGEAIKNFNRENYLISTKVGLVRNSKDVMQMSLNGRPEYIKKSCDASLKRLGIEYIDIYFLHRVDPNCPIEESIGALHELIQHGKIKYIGLSDTTLDIIDRAIKIHPVAAYQAEYSLWDREIEKKNLLQQFHKRNIVFMPYCPLGRGFLAGELQNFSDYQNKDDVRGSLPKFYRDNFKNNLQLLDGLKNFCTYKNITLAQLAISWLLKIDSKIMPIVGMRHSKQVDENIESTNIVLTKEDMYHLNELMPIDCSWGDAYPSTMEVH